MIAIRPCGSFKGWAASPLSVVCGAAIPVEYCLRSAGGFSDCRPTAGIGASFGRKGASAVYEARYTYWTDQAIAVRPPLPVTADISAPPSAPPTIFSTHNQIQLLVGIMF